MSSPDPTPAMIDRAEAWLKFVKTLDSYFAAAASTLEQRSEQSARLSNSVHEKDLHDLLPNFAPRGKSGVNDVLPTILSMHEAEAKAASRAAKLLGSQLRPELESLTADINKSIGDFRGYSASFSGEGGASAGAAKGESPKETYSGNDESLFNGPLKAQIAEYQEAVAAAAAHKSPKVDPYILKLAIDKKIAKLSKGRNQLSDSYAYTQDATKEVDAGVTERLQSILGRYADAVGNLGQASLEGSSSLLGGFVAHPRMFEYQHYLESSKAPRAFQSKQAARLQAPARTDEAAYPDEDSIYSKALRTGELERRTKFLHSYSPGDYVLTPQSLIELKSGLPVWSLDLNGAKLLEDHKASTPDQFVLQARQHGSNSGKLHTFVFRARVAQNWRRELAAITAGEVPPSLESIVRAQNTPDSAPAGSTASEAGISAVKAPQSGASTVASGVPPTSSTASGPASAVAASGGAATSRPDATPSFSSTDAIAPSSKHAAASPQPSARGLGPEPTHPFPKVEHTVNAPSAQGQTPLVNSSANPSANPFDDLSNPALTAVPVAGVAGAAAAVAPNFGRGATPQRTLDPAAGGVPGSSGSATNPFQGAAATAPAGPAGSASATRDLGTAAPYNLNEGQLQHPVDKVDAGLDPRSPGDLGTDERVLGSGAPFVLKGSQLQHPTDKVDAGADPRFAAGASSGSRDLGAAAPYDLKASQLQHPTDKVDAGADPRYVGLGAGAGAAAGAATGAATSESRVYGGSAPYGLKESQLQDPVDKVHDSDSEMSDAEQGFHNYFDKEDAEPRFGTIAWQAKQDMQVFDRPVGFAAVEDPRPAFVKTAEDEQDDASTWSYDATHENKLNTFRDDPNFKPTDSDLPVQLERRLTNTHHKLERPVVEPMRTEEDAGIDPEQALQRRRSSVSSAKQHRSPSRRATGSYGDENDLKPLSSLTPLEKSQALSGDSALVFSDMPKTTSGGN